MTCALVLVHATPATAATAAVSSGSGGMPVGLTALGAVLGLLAFGARQWWSRDGRGRRL